MHLHKRMEVLLAASNANAKKIVLHDVKRILNAKKMIIGNIIYYVCMNNFQILLKG